jgi:hypothetical protein
VKIFVMDRHAKSNLVPRARNPGERIFSAIKKEISRASNDDLVRVVSDGESKRHHTRNEQ